MSEFEALPICPKCAGDDDLCGVEAKAKKEKIVCVLCGCHCKSEFSVIAKRVPK